MEDTITRGSFEKVLELLEASRFTKYNVIIMIIIIIIMAIIIIIIMILIVIVIITIIIIIIMMSIAKHSSIPKASSQNGSSIKSDFKDFKSNFIETLNVQKELSMNQLKELFIIKMSLF